MTNGAPGVPPPGWYPDPGGSGDERWWDGRQWTDRTRPPALVTDWRGWLARSPRARTIGRVISYAAAAGAAGALVVDVTALIRDKPLPGLAIVFLLATPVLGCGQLWAIAQMNARVPRLSGKWRDQWRARRSLSRNPRNFLFGSLPARLAYPLLGVALAGWLSAMTAIPVIAGGAPDGAQHGCAYTLDSRGGVKCVTKQAYEHAGAGVQRFASGILLAFFALHTGAALGGLYGSRGSRR